MMHRFFFRDGAMCSYYCYRWNECQNDWHDVVHAPITELADNPVPTFVTIMYYRLPSWRFVNNSATLLLYKLTLILIVQHGGSW